MQAHSAAVDEKPQARRWDHNVYRCADGTKVACRYNAVGKGGPALRNCILSQKGVSISVVAETVTNRDMTEIISGGQVKTYAFPRTAVTVKAGAFKNKQEL